MNEEIKEILDRLDFNEWEVDLYKVPITWSELYDIRDYITNLQKENQSLKKEIEHYKIMFSNYFYEELYPGENEENDIYKQRNEKAIEYIENPNICIDIRKTDGSLDYISTDILLNILKGGDE